MRQPTPDEVILAFELDLQLAQPLTDLLSACVKAARAKGVDPTLVVASVLANAIVGVRRYATAEEFISLLHALAITRLEGSALGLGFTRVELPEKPRKDAD